MTADPVTAAVHIDVQALDSEGTAPDVESAPPADRLLSLRGRDFVVVVEADGLVRSVEPARRPDDRSKLLKDTAASAPASASAADAKAAKTETAADDAPLRDLRFRATGRSRRVLVQIR